jgi:hypothetical protein
MRCNIFGALGALRTMREELRVRVKFGQDLGARRRILGSNQVEKCNVNRREGKGLKGLREEAERKQNHSHCSTTTPTAEVVGGGGGGGKG